MDIQKVQAGRVLPEEPLQDWRSQTVNLSRTPGLLECPLWQGRNLCWGPLLPPHPMWEVWPRGTPGLTPSLSFPLYKVRSGSASCILGSTARHRKTSWAPTWEWRVTEHSWEQHDPFSPCPKPMDVFLDIADEIHTASRASVQNTDSKEDLCVTQVFTGEGGNPAVALDHSPHPDLWKPGPRWNQGLPVP